MTDKKDDDLERMYSALTNIICICAPDIDGKYDFDRIHWEVEQNARYGINDKHNYIEYDARRKPANATQCPTHTDQRWLGDRYETCGGCQLEMHKTIMERHYTAEAIRTEERIKALSHKPCTHCAYKGFTLQVGRGRVDCTYCKATGWIAKPVSGV